MPIIANNPDYGPILYNSGRFGNYILSYCFSSCASYMCVVACALANKTLTFDYNTKRIYLPDILMNAAALKISTQGFDENKFLLPNLHFK